MIEICRIPLHEFARVTKALDRGELEIVDEVKKPCGVTFDADLARRLAEHASEGKWTNEGERWLTPRLHSVLRIPRRIASDRGVWFWLAVTAFKPYVDSRFGRSERAEDPWWRFTGDALRNGVSRLWWGAELLRSAGDYSLVPHAYRTVRTYMFVSELRYSWYREATRAFARVASGQESETDGPLSDEAIQELSKRFNTYLALDVLESHGGPAESNDCEWDRDWAVRTPVWEELSGEGPLM